MFINIKKTGDKSVNTNLDNFCIVQISNNIYTRYATTITLSQHTRVFSLIIIFLQQFRRAVKNARFWYYEYECEAKNEWYQ